MTRSHPSRSSSSNPLAGLAACVGMWRTRRRRSSGRLQSPVAALTVAAGFRSTTCGEWTCRNGPFHHPVGVGDPRPMTQHTAYVGERGTDKRQVAFGVTNIQAAIVLDEETRHRVLIRHHYRIDRHEAASVTERQT